MPTKALGSPLSSFVRLNVLSIPVLLTLVAAIAISVLAAIGFAYSGFYDVSASSPHSGPVAWLLSTTSHASVKRHAKDIDVPNLDQYSLAAAGATDFNAMCVGCHGAPGKQPAALARGLNPPAPDLAESAGHLAPAELFWVTKHGIKMTGMPAWGATHDDGALWPVVAFMTVLPTLDADGYQALLISAKGGHHGADDESFDESSDHQHGGSGHQDQTDPTEAAEHDHAAHSHGKKPPVDEPKVEEEEHDHDEHAH